MARHAGPVLVTGGTGFLGRWLVRSLLSSGDEVVVLARPSTSGTHLPQRGSAGPGRLHHEVGDVMDHERLGHVLRAHGVTSVYHAAARSTVHTGRADPLATFSTNVRGTWNVLEACRQFPLVDSVVVASSDKAYGDSPVLPYTEDSPLLGRGPYEVSKACSDLIAQSYGSAMGVPVATIRAGNFYGGGDLTWSRLVPGTLRRLLAGQAPVLRGDGSSIRDYVYVEDAAEAFLTLGSQLPHRPDLHGRAFNVASRVTLSTLDLVKTLTEAVGSSAAPVLGERSTGEIPAQYLDPALFEQELGWWPRTPLLEGVRRTVAWYRDYLADSGAPSSIALRDATTASATSASGTSSRWEATSQPARTASSDQL